MYNFFPHRSIDDSAPSSIILKKLDEIEDLITEEERIKYESSFILLLKLYPILNAVKGGISEFCKDEGLLEAISIVKPFFEEHCFDISSFLNPQFEKEDYLEAFRRLMSGYMDRYVDLGILGKIDIPGDMNRLPLRRFTSIDEWKSMLVVQPFYFIEESYSKYQRVVLYESGDHEVAILHFCKALLGDVWNNVEIISKYAPFSYGKFDGILVYQIGSIDGFINALDKMVPAGSISRDFSRPWKGSSYSFYSDILSDGGEMVLINFGQKDYSSLLNPLWRDRSTKIDSICSFDGWLSSIKIRHSDSNSRRTVTCASYRSKIASGEFYPERTLDVNNAVFCLANLSPLYYFWLHDNSQEKDGTVPLIHYLTPLRPPIATKDLKVDSRLIPKLDAGNLCCDPSLFPSLPPKRSISNGLLTLFQFQGTILLVDNHSWTIDYISSDDFSIPFIESSIQNDGLYGYVYVSDMMAFTVDKEKVDIRYLVMALRDIDPPETMRLLPKDHFLSIRISDMPLDQQKAEVAKYLKERSNEMLRDVVSDKDREIKVIVAAPYIDTFKTQYTSQLEENNFTVVDSCEDPREGLGQLIGNHFGPSVLAADKADLLLISTSFGSEAVENALIKILKYQDLGVKARFFDERDGFGESFEFRLEDAPDLFKEQYVPGEDFLKQIREGLNQMSPNIYTKYETFFTAAEKLDKDYGWGESEYSLVKFGEDALSSGEFIKTGNEIRTIVHNTICRFYIDKFGLPKDINEGAIPKLVFFGSAYHNSVGSDGKMTSMQIVLQEDFGAVTKNERITINEARKEEKEKDSWYHQAFFFLNSFGNMGSHGKDLSMPTETNRAAFLVFMEFIIWFERIRVRYDERKYSLLRR